MASLNLKYLILSEDIAFGQGILALQHIESKSALAYRIREAPKIAAQIADLLDDVAESLDDGERPSFVVIMFSDCDV